VPAPAPKPRAAGAAPLELDPALDPFAAESISVCAGNIDASRPRCPESIFTTR